MWRRHQDPTPEALRPLASGVLRTMGAEQQVQAILAKVRVQRGRNGRGRVR